MTAEAVLCLPLQFGAILAHEAVKSVVPEAGAVVSASFLFSCVCFLMLLMTLVVSPLALCSL